MMVRTQISLPAEEHKRAKRHAADLGVSLAEYVRQALARDLRSDERHASPSALVDLGESGVTGVSSAKDRHVADVVAVRHARRSG